MGERCYTIDELKLIKHKHLYKIYKKQLYAKKTSMVNNNTIKKKM